MQGRLFVIIEITVLTSFFSLYPTDAQILQDSAAITLIRKDIDYIYNLEIDNAKEAYSEIVRLYPEHPVVYLLRGFITYWENYPLLPTTPSLKLFEEDMHKCIKLSENNKNHDYEAEYLLADLCARGMLLTFYSDNDLIAEVIPLTISTYKYVRKSFDFTGACADLYYFTGLYNYYREAYPREFPVYKSLALLFPPGSIETGLNELKTTSVNAIVLSPESYYLLTWIFLNFENDYNTSLVYSGTLSEKYPGNTLYQATYIKNLLLLKQYEEAEKLIHASYGEEENLFFWAQLKIFNGILQEKKYQNNELAQQLYKEGINEISFYGEYGNEYAAYAYYGLARISDANRDRHAARMYRNQAQKVAAFKKITFDK